MLIAKLLQYQLPLPVKDPILKKQIQARYREKHREILKIRHKQYYENNRTIILQKSKIWHKNWLAKGENKERKREISNRWWKEHPEKKKESDRKYYLNHKEKWNNGTHPINKERAKEWWSENKDKAKIYYRRRSHRLKIFYYQNREKLLHILNQFWCQRCGEHDKRCLHIDHINDDGYTDWKRFGTPFEMRRYYIVHPDEAKANLQLLCSNCNWKKRYEKSSSLKPAKGGVVID